MPSANAEAKAAASDVRPGPYRVMVVDDSVVVRGLITRALEQDPEVEVVASVGNGQQAVSASQRHKIEVVVLDIEMPVMDGMTALGKLLEADPAIKVIMASTLTKRNAEISMRALASGASDYLAKPSATRDLVSASEFQRDLLGKVKALGAARRGGSGRVSARAVSVDSQPSTVTAAPARLGGSGPIVLRRPGSARPEVLVIASSTGGPQALMTVLGALSERMTLPILITQHMPPTFTTILAEHLARQTKRVCQEAADGATVVSGRIYIAPGDFHMLVEQRGGQRVIRLDKGPAENFCRPAADPMLRSVARAYGGRALIVVLTGMGHDGAQGAREVVEAGGTLIAQDEATSVVWGMPGAVAQAGLCSAVLPVGEIASYVQRFVGGGAS
jgi:two-component system chemotaxis response regulator CheB